MVIEMESPVKVVAFDESRDPREPLVTSSRRVVVLVAWDLVDFVLEPPVVGPGEDVLDGHVKVGPRRARLNVHVEPGVDATECGRVVRDTRSRKKENNDKAPG